MKPHTLARKLGCSVEIAAKIIKAFYARAPRASAYIDHTLAIAEELGFAETHYGRRRYCPEYQSPIAKREDHEIEKTLWNHVVAGTAAEVLKWKQVKVWEFLRHIGYMPNQVRLCLQMFDELIFAVEDTVIEEVCDLAEGIMRTPEPGFLPFKVGVKLGKTWRECSK
jgi:DNA polymerase-1